MDEERRWYECEWYGKTEGVNENKYALSGLFVKETRTLSYSYLPSFVRAIMKYLNIRKLFKKLVFYIAFHFKSTAGVLNSDMNKHKREMWRWYLLDKRCCHEFSMENISFDKSTKWRASNWEMSKRICSKNFFARVISSILMEWCFLIN